MDADLNVKYKTVRVLEQNVGDNLWNLGLGKKFLDLMPKEQPTKGKTDKLDFNKIKNFALKKTLLR